MTIRTSFIRKILDLSMIFLIFWASFVLVFVETEHFYSILFMMAVFLYYFVTKRCRVYFGDKNKGKIIHELPGKTESVASEKKNRFNQQYQKRQIEKSRMDMLIKNKDDSLNNSNISYMNRSKRANQSMSRSYISSNNALSDFDFLANKESGSMMKESTIRNRGLDDSYIRNFTSSQHREQEISRQVRKNMTECTTRYVKTLQKLKATPYSASTSIKKIRQLCLILCKQSYKQHIENLKSFIELFTQIYDIKIHCKQVADLELLLRIIPQQKQQKLQISLSEILKKVRKSDRFDQIGIPVRDRNNQGFSHFRRVNSSQRFVQSIVQEKPVISQQNKGKLKKLLLESEKLSSTFYNNNLMYLTPQQLLTKIQTLKQYIQEEQSQQSKYEIINNSKLSEQYSERLLIGFNISKNKLNQLISVPEYQLSYKKKSYLGWLKLSSPNIYQIKQTLNSDHGHPHYDLLYGKENKQEYGCEYGRNNGYCLLWVYLLLMQANNVEIIRGNKKMENIYSRYLGIIVL